MGKIERAQINGIELFYADRGEGLPVWFVHVDGRIWDDHGEIIGSRYRVIAPTQRYFGVSPRPLSLFLYEPALATFVSDPSAARRATEDRLEMIRETKLAASDGNVGGAVELFMDGVNDSNGSFRNLPDKVQRVMLENARMLPLLFAAPPPPQITCANLRHLECIPGARFITIPKARHLWPIENPSAFSRLVLDFLEEDKRSAL